MVPPRVNPTSPFYVAGGPAPARKKTSLKTPAELKRVGMVRQRDADTAEYNRRSRLLKQRADDGYETLTPDELERVDMVRRRDAADAV